MHFNIGIIGFVIAVSCIGTTVALQGPDLNFTIVHTHPKDATKNCSFFQAEGFNLIYYQEKRVGKTVLPTWTYVVNDQMELEPTGKTCKENYHGTDIDNELEVIGWTMRNPGNSEISIQFVMANSTNNNYDIQSIEFRAYINYTLGGYPQIASSFGIRKPEWYHPVALGRSFTCKDRWYMLSENWYLQFKKIKYQPFMENGELGKELDCTGETTASSAVAVVSTYVSIISALLLTKTLTY